MQATIPYLVLGGRCAEALRFYAEVFDAKVEGLIRHGEVTKGLPDDQASKVMHAELHGPGVHLFLTDGQLNLPAPPPTHAIMLALALDDANEQDRIWAKLGEGGEVLKELHPTFYGGRLGMLQDRFGVIWLLNVMPEAPPAK